MQEVTEAPVEETQESAVVGAEAQIVSSAESVRDEQPADLNVSSEVAPGSTQADERSEQSSIDPKARLVNKIMAVDASLTQEGADVAANKEALMAMDEQDLQDMFDHEQQKVLIDQVIRVDAELNQSTPEFLQQYRERLKKLPNDALQNMIGGQQDRLEGDEAGLERGDQLPSPDSFRGDEQLAAPIDGLTEDERWYGVDGQAGGGLIGGALESKYGAQFLEEARNEVTASQKQELIDEVNRDFLQKWSDEKDKPENTDDMLSFFEKNKEEIETEVKAKILAKIESLKNEKIEKLQTELRSMDWEQAIEVMTGEKFPKEEDGSLPEGSKIIQFMNQLKKDKVFQFIMQNAMGLGKSTLDNLGETRFDDLLDTLMGLNTGISYRDTLSSFKESNTQYNKEMNLTGFKELISKNRKGGEGSNFKAYDRVIGGLLKGCSKELTSYDVDDSLFKDLEDGDKDGIQKKADELYQIFSDLMKKGEVESINKVFVWAFSVDGGKLLGTFDKNQLPNEEVLLHFKNLKKKTEYQDNIGDSSSLAQPTQLAA